MKGWAILMTVVVVIAGVCVMFLWGAINQILAGQAAAVDWPRSLVSLLVFLLCIGFFVRFVTQFEEPAEA